jgi:hypothetical protein
MGVAEGNEMHTVSCHGDGSLPTEEAVGDDQIRLAAIRLAWAASPQKLERRVSREAVNCVSFAQ